MITTGDKPTPPQYLAEALGLLGELDKCHGQFKLEDGLCPCETCASARSVGRALFLRDYEHETKGNRHMELQRLTAELNRFCDSHDLAHASADDLKSALEYRLDGLSTLPAGITRRQIAWLADYIERWDAATASDHVRDDGGPKVQAPADHRCAQNPVEVLAEVMMNKDWGLGLDPRHVADEIVSIAARCGWEIDATPAPVKECTLFRWHRGGLDESMKTAVPCHSMIGLLQILNLAHRMTFINVTAARVKVQDYIYDERVGWHTYTVTVDGQAVGFTNGPLSDPFGGLGEDSPKCERFRYTREVGEFGDTFECRTIEDLFPLIVRVTNTPIERGKVIVKFNEVDHRSDWNAHDVYLDGTLVGHLDGPLAGFTVPDGLEP